MTDLLEKQRHAVNVVKTALDSAGIHDRDVWASCGSCTSAAECVENCAVFVSAPPGADIEPYYEIGKTITEAVRKILATIKGHEIGNGAKPEEQSDTAPF